MPDDPVNPAPPPKDRKLTFRARFGALYISVAYLVVGLLWIALSDYALAYLARTTGDPLGIIERGSLIKGWLFIIATAFLLFLLIRSHIRSIEKTNRQFRDDLAQTAAAYQILFQSNPLPSWVYTPDDLRILAVNDVALRAYGYTREEFLRLNVLDFHAPENKARALQIIRPNNPLADKERVSAGWTLLRKDRSALQADIYSHPIVFEGRRARLVLTIDVTERLKTNQLLAEYRTHLEEQVLARTSELSQTNHQLTEQIAERQRVEAQLRDAKLVAESANKAKSAFLANTSHEIRTPLTSILGYTDLIVEPDLPATQRQRYVAIIQQNAAHLLKLIDDLLDLSRVEMGKMRVTLDDYSPREIAQQAVDLLRPRAVEKSLHLYLETADDVPALIKTDGVRLRQVLVNLISNAIKFTPMGHVAVSVRSFEINHAAPPDAARRFVRFEVSDTGIGMKPEQLTHIFEPFFQVDQGATRRYEGSGLGLAISRQITQQMGGSIDACSEFGRGAIFSVQIPVTPPLTLLPPETSPLADAQESRLQAHILLAEDNANIRWLVEEYLRRAGATVTPVSSGLEALQRVTAAIAPSPDSPTPPIDLILMDIHMPGMDGPQAMRHIRQAGYQGPIVALTAHSVPAETRQWLDAGCNAVAPKPIDRNTFIPLIASLLREHQAKDRPPVTPPP